MNAKPTPYLLASLIVLVTTLFTDSAVGLGIKFERQADKLFLRCADVAEALGFEFNVVNPERLVTFCQGGAGGICIPVRLTADNHRRDGEELLVAADLLAAALRFRVNDAGKTVTVTRQALTTNDGLKYETPAYNADWDRGRGFGKGDTLPDIPLVDLQGNEVRFSQFLGKRYILYCWASW